MHLQLSTGSSNQLYGKGHVQQFQATSQRFARMLIVRKAVAAGTTSHSAG